MPRKKTEIEPKILASVSQKNPKNDRAKNLPVNPAAFSSPNLKGLPLDEFLLDQNGLTGNKQSQNTSKNQRALAELDDLIGSFVKIEKNVAKSGGLRIRHGITGLNSDVAKKFSGVGNHLLNLNKNRSALKPQPILSARLDFKKTAARIASPKLLKQSLVFSFNFSKLLSCFKFLHPAKKIAAQNYFTHRLKNETSNKQSSLGLNLKTALNFCLVALLLIIPIKGLFIYEHLAKTKGQVLGVTETALANWQEGLRAAAADDWAGAGWQFNESANNFMAAGEILNQYDRSFMDLLKALPLGGKIAQAEKLIEAGELISQTATDLSALLGQIKKPVAGFQLKEIQPTANRLEKNLHQVISLLNEVDAALLPTEQQSTFLELKKSLPEIEKQLSQAGKLFNFTLEILGYNASKRYLVIFGNNNEIRSAFGFMGSFALVDLAAGKIVKMEVPGGGFYDLKGDFFEKIIAPEPFHILGTAWQIWNANWWPDFPTSAQKIVWFFEHAGWPTPDGVIALNATILPEIIKTTGDIYLPKYDQKLTPNNVIVALQHETEFEYDKTENKPKKVIGDLLPIVIEKLFKTAPEQYLPLLLTLEQSIKNKDAQFYFNAEATQAAAKTFGLTGEINGQAGQDYLRIDRTNVAGGKTDLVIKQQIKHYAEIKNNGSIVDTVAITLTHQGNPEDVFERAQNNSYIRVYVPAGSQLLGASGYDTIPAELFKEIYPGYEPDKDLLRISGVITKDPATNTAINNEFGKTVFGNWLQLKPGEEKTLTFSYQLPFKLELKANFWQKILQRIGLKLAKQDHYLINFQSQSGVKNSTLASYVLLPKNLSIGWSQASWPENLAVAKNNSTFIAPFTQDLYYGLLIGQ